MTMHANLPAADSAPEFDVGPLSWVQVEIGNALARGLDLLALFRATPSDPSLLRQARNQIHQAVGAIQMVGLDAAVTYTEEVERQLGRLEQMQPTDVGLTCAVIDRACRKLAIFLDEMVAGTPPVPLKLFPEYDAMQRLRGVKAAPATDLFFPELRLREPLPGAHLPPVGPKKLASHLVKQRRVYQNGLLAFLRGDSDGAQKMREAAAGMERVSVQESARAFWWTVGAFFEAIVAGGLDPGFGAKQLAARLDLQIRRVVEGSVKVATRLRREVLYYVAVSSPATPTIAAVQRSYGLMGLIPSAEALNADLIRLQPILREMREQLGTAKNIWLRVSLGRADSLPKLRDTLQSVNANAVAVGNAAMNELTASLVACLDSMPPSGEVPDVFAMEYATAILLAESAASNYGGLASNFPKQVTAMLARLEAARESRPLPEGTGALIDGIFRRAQERVLLAQVAREIQVNLRRMEQVLDAFFRDPAKRSEIAALGKDSHQVRGALRMLEQDDAERLLGLCEARIESYANPETPVAEGDLELLAESLSALGFYVEALEQQRSDRRRLIMPLLARHLGEIPEAQDEGPTETVEDAVEDLRAVLPLLVAEIRRAPADPAARASLTAKLKDLVDDATLIDDAELVVQAQEALAELEALAAVDTGGTVALEAALTAIAESGAPVAAPAPALSAETQRLLATDANRLDAELLEIFLIEATEVLDAVVENRAELERNPGDREALRSARRQFHTIKGSGRMVGLNELGELAYDVEKIHNRLLEEEYDVTPAMLELLAVAEANFRRWVGALQDKGDVYADPAELYAAIRRVEAELPAEFDADVPSAPPSAAVTAAAPSPAPVAPELPELPEIELPLVTAASPAEAAPPVAVEAAAGETTHAPVADSVEAEAAPEPVAWIETAEEGEETGAEIIEFSPVGEMPAGAIADDRAPPPPDIVMIGEVSMPADLFAVLIEEAGSHLAALDHGISLMQFDPRQGPTADMVRASHTLCGIHRAGGFPLIALTAQALERCLLALQPLPAPLPTEALPALADAVGGLREFLGRVKEKRGFNATDVAIAAEIQQELETVRQMAAARPEGAVDAEPEAAPAEAETAAPAAAEIVAPAAVDIVEAAEEAVLPAAQEVVEPAPVNMVEAAADEAFAPAEIDEPAPGDVTDAVAAEAAEAIEPEVAEAAELATASAVEPVGSEADLPATAEAPEPWPAPEGVQASIPPVRPAAPVVEPVRREAPQDPLADIRDDVDPQVLPIFLEEAAELYPQAGERVRAWRRVPGDDARARQLRRTLHTFKGSARMAGAMRLGELVHLMESRLDVDGAPVPGSAELFEALDGDLDRIAFVLDALREGKTNVALSWTTERDDAAAAEPGRAAAAEATAAAPGDRTVVVSLSTPDGAQPHAAADDVDVDARSMLRVRADIIDRLVNEAGEVAIARARIESELRALKANLLELTGSVIRLRTQVREIEIQAESQIQSRLMQVGEGQEGFDPLEFDRYTRFQELARSLGEGVNDVSTVQQSLLKNLDVADAALIIQGRLARDVQQQLFSIRTVPFGSLSERLYRIMRGTARELGKRANLEIQGGQTELDRAVLEKLVGPLEHLLRNALDHGIEPRAQRTKAGKSETGEITLTVRQVANEIAIELADDGAGLNLEGVRAKAVAQGRIAADAQPTDAQLIQCIFEPGFSTASRVTLVSGRGIGMDVVRSEIAALGGRVEVSTRAGHGTTFLLYLPLTLAVAQAVMVRAGGRLWALPAPMVEQVQHVKADVLVNMYVQRRVENQGVSYPFHYLPRLLGDSHQIPESTRSNPVLLLRSGQSVAAIHVDEMVGNQEVVVKNIGPQLARVSGIAGATVLGNGEVVLIINPVQIAQRTDVPEFDPNAERVAPEVPKMAVVQAGKPLVMIVDDSLTVRRITSRLLSREGFDVLTARDGIDALEVLENEPETPSVILLDIEMPRMDGFEFTKTIKANPKHASIPIVMITSRTAEKHRNLAKDLGVDLYLGKPFQEEELLRHLRDMLALTP